MDEQDAAKIAKLVQMRLDEQRSIDVETHHKHHEYIDTLITQAETRQARKEQWVRVVGGWGIILTITAFAAAVWEYFKDHLK